jgi:general secretion pathway protein I
VKRRFPSGFTLLEVLVALALVAGVLTSSIVVFNRHLSLVVRDREETSAMLLCRAKLEEPGFLTSLKADGTFAPEHPDMTWKREEVPSNYPGLRRFTLTVSWQQGRRNLTMVTYDRK